MEIQAQIKSFIQSLEEPKRSEIQALHLRILGILPGCRQWFETGINDEGKVVSNPNIGYGQYTIEYANGTSRDFFQIGVSPNKTGISVYILGLKDKTFLANNYSDKLGKASITGYCIKFKSSKDVDLDVLDEAILEGVKQTNPK